MKSTSHDISGSKIKFSLSELTKTAEIAVGGMRVQVEKYIGEIQIGLFHGKDVRHSANHLAQAAQNLAQAIATLEALRAAKSREELELIKDLPE